MNFAEFRFWVYWSLGMAVLLALRGLLSLWKPSNKVLIGRYDRLALLGLGLFLLGCVSLLTVAIFITVSLITYTGLRLYLRHEGHRRWIVLSALIPLQLLPLLYFKYSHFIVNDIFRMQVGGLLGLMIPVGLSFYTFQLVGFVVDTVMTRKPLPPFIDFMNFAGFFPQIVAGPIERREHLLPQVSRFRFNWDRSALQAGLPWIVLGLYLKIGLADNLANHFDPSSIDNPFLIWMNNLVFGLRIYYDFAGYSFIALGMARCLGIHLTINFTSPYISRNAQEFWRRWHITLSTWFRDYLYIPLGGNRVRMWALNILVVFVVSGIWHGAGWNFILWGAIWGVALIAWIVSNPQKPWPAPIAWFLTMVTAFYAWLCFYETRTGVLVQKLATISNPFNYTVANWQAARTAIDPTSAFVLGGILFLCVVTLIMEWASVHKAGRPYAFLLHPVTMFVLIILTILLAPAEQNDFIYFAF